MGYRRSSHTHNDYTIFLMKRTIRAKKLAQKPHKKRLKKSPAKGTKRVVKNSPKNSPKKPRKKSYKKRAYNRHATPDVIYARWKRELKGIHRFSFRNTKRFSPQQKAAIRRAYNKYAHIIYSIKKGGNVRVLPASSSEIRAASGRYEHTNIGLVVYSRADKFAIIKKRDRKKFFKSLRTKNKRIPKKYTPDTMTEEESDRLLRLGYLKELFGDFSERTVVWEKGAIREQVFIPLLSERGETIDELIDYVWYFFNPTHILLSVGKSQSTQSYTKNDWENYRETLLALEFKIGTWQKERGKPIESPYNGVYAVWHTGRQLRTNPTKGA